MPWQPRKIEIDFELIRNSSAKDGLLHLIRRRTDTLYEHLSDLEPNASSPIGDYGFRVPEEIPALRLPDKGSISENDEFGLVNGRMLFAPVHPLILTMALSVACVRPDQDATASGEAILTSYIAGIRIPHVGPLTQLEQITDDQAVSRILDLNDAYRTALEELAESVLVLNGKLVPFPLALLSPNVDANTLPKTEVRASWLKDATVNRLDLLCACWLVTNPVFQLNIEYGWRRSAAFCKELNSTVHNTIEHLDFLVDEINQRVNELLKHGDDDAELMLALSRQRNISRQLLRARRFYEWDADEIWANEAGNTAMGTTSTSHALPQRLLEQLRVRRE